MQAPLAVVNDGRHRTIVWVNDGDNPIDVFASGKYFYSLPMTVTFNIGAWGCAGGGQSAPYAVGSTRLTALGQTCRDLTSLARALECISLSRQWSDPRPLQAARGDRTDPDCRFQRHGV